VRLILGTFADFCAGDSAISAVGALSCAVHNAPGRVVPLLDDEWLARLLSQLDPLREPLSAAVFAALDNIAFCDTHLALRVISGGFFSFDVPSEWCSATCGVYCRAVWTLARRLGERRSGARDAESEGCLRAVRGRAATLVPALVAALAEGACAAREAAASALCALVNLNDSELMHVCVAGNAQIVPQCAELLLVRNEALASAVICALVKLCEFADRLAFADENPFLAAARDAGIDIDDVLAQVAEIYSDSEDICAQLEKLAQAVLRAREHEEVDFG
jgi:hypothetical protein